MPRDAHDRLIARLRLGKFCNRMVPEVVEAQPGQRAFDAANIGFAFCVRTLFGGLLYLIT